MSNGTLTVDLDSIKSNWLTLDSMSTNTVETAAVVKADAYGLGAKQISLGLAKAGARKFFVASAEEGKEIRAALGEEAIIYIFSGHMAGKSSILQQSKLIPLLNSPEQNIRHQQNLPTEPFGVQLDTGMNRLGFERADFTEFLELYKEKAPELVISHLACADNKDDLQNANQLKAFLEMTSELNCPLSLAATGGIFLGKEYHFDICRPGIGLYGGAPFKEAKAVVNLSLPVIQTRALAPEEAVGYGATWTAHRPSLIATLSAGYADGLIRAMSGRAVVYANGIPCPIAGRVSMDLITVDVTHLTDIPEHMEILCEQQSIDQLADEAGTIGYEILTSLGNRYNRSYTGV